MGRLKRLLDALGFEIGHEEAEARVHDGINTWQTGTKTGVACTMHYHAVPSRR